MTFSIETLIQLILIRNLLRTRKKLIKLIKTRTFFFLNLFFKLKTHKHFFYNFYCRINTYTLILKNFNYFYQCFNRFSLIFSQNISFWRFFHHFFFVYWLNHVILTVRDIFFRATQQKKMCEKMQGCIWDRKKKRFIIYMVFGKYN